MKRFSKIDTNNVKNQTGKIIDVAVMLKELFNLLGKKIVQPKTLDELAETYSNATDEVIIKSINEGLNFIGGTLTIAPNDKKTDSIIVAFEMYFQNAQEKWIKKSDQVYVSKSKLTDEAYEELVMNKKVEYQIEQPKTETIETI